MILQIIRRRGPPRRQITKVTMNAARAKIADITPTQKLDAGELTKDAAVLKGSHPTRSGRSYVRT
jgi:hypothetical protein